MSEAVRNMKDLTITIPSPPQPTRDAAGTITPVLEVDFYLWKRDHTKAQDRKDKYDEGMKNAYAIIFHQCSPALKTELEGSDDFPAIHATQDVLKLLQMIKGMCCSFDDMMAMVEAHKCLYMYFQKDGVDNQTYHREFMAHVETIETYGGRNTIGCVPSLIRAELRRMEMAGEITSALDATDDETKLAQATVRDEYLAAMLLSGANYNRFEKLREHLSNLFAMGDDRYPKTVISCLNMLDRF